MKNTAIIAIGNICTKCISFFMLPLYTSILTTEEYGTVDLVSTYATLLIIILSLQMEQGVFRFLIESRGDKQKQSDYIYTTLAAVFFVCLLFGIVSAPLLGSIGYKYRWYLVAWAVIGTFNAVILQLPRGIGNNVVYATGSFISGSSNVILNVLFIAVLKKGINGMLLANTLALLLCFVYISLKLGLVHYIRNGKYDKHCFKELSSYSFPLIPYTLCWWIINASDRQVINFFLGTSANGIYSIACKFPSLFSLVTGIFQTAWTESAAENVNDEDRNVYYERTVNRTIRFYSAGTVGIIACIPLVFNFLIKNSFRDAYVFIPILMVGGLLHAITSLYGSIYFAFKRTKEVAWTTALAALLNIVINVMFIKYIGIYAAAISTLASYLVVFVIRQIDIQHIAKIRIPKKYLFQEALSYLVVLVAFYSRNLYIEVAVLIALIPYCMYQNKEVMGAFLTKGKKMIRK